MPDKSGLVRYLVAIGVPRLTGLMENFMKKRVNGHRINARKNHESDSFEFGEELTE
jgi:hypothetical protein